ncbi:hypothetical protein GA707_03860 [Nostocoides sp. F2B08]|uniref:hypothetical protein n=1 Tax=Nostocoides sp. F2B08 TaxID=2653936 RepID=UPI0012631D33|nr:hypothetical protein [Tetrasphaera sp. F2B08]KAB7745115.1 hypothetical protein GA707_03860 [Tetrasphaera sp. F2B08]
MLTYTVGVFLPLGPLDHVVVSALHLLFGGWLGAGVGYDDAIGNVALATPGNIIGGLLPMTLTHAARPKASRRS